MSNNTINENESQAPNPNGWNGQCASNSREATNECDVSHSAAPTRHVIPFQIRQNLTDMIKRPVWIDYQGSNGSIIVQIGLPRNGYPLQCQQNPCHERVQEDAMPIPQNRTIGFQICAACLDHASVLWRKSNSSCCCYFKQPQCLDD